MQLWQDWWVWMAAAFVLGILETLASGYVLLGFAGGALVTGVLLLVGLAGGSVALTILVFAVASLVCWWALRRVFGWPKDPAKIVRHDINDN